MIIHLILTTLAGSPTDHRTSRIRPWSNFLRLAKVVLWMRVGLCLPQLGTETGRCDLAHLRDCDCFAVVVSSCLEEPEHEGQMQDEVKALQVPFYFAHRVFLQAFFPCCKGPACAG